MTKAKAPTFVITVSGSDASGGAGLQADNRAIHATGAFPLNVVTALTLQTERGVQSVEFTPPELVRMHLVGLLNTFPVTVIKAGMLGNAGIVAVLADTLAQYTDVRLVLDPVIEASSGRPLLDSEGIAALKKLLLPRTYLVTPNLSELAKLVGLDSVDSPGNERSAANLLLESGCQWVLVKGGHRPGSVSEDRLYQVDFCKTFSAKRIFSQNTRGTGCSLSSLIAGKLACGKTIEDAVQGAKKRLSESLISHGKETWPISGPSFP